MVDQGVADKVLEAARMVVTERLGESRPAHGFFIIVGNANEIFAGEAADPEGLYIKRCKYGKFRADLDRRSLDLKISDCFGDEDKRMFLLLFNEDGAIVVDGQTGQVCCGGFLVHDTASGIGTGGARTKAASAMATHANGCYVVLASQDICGSALMPVSQKAKLKVFEYVNEPREVPVRVSDSLREQSFEQWLHPLKFGGDLHPHHQAFVEGTRQWVFNDLESWRCDLKDSRCRVLLAGPGFGKTAIAARLYKMRRRVLAIHLCRYNDQFKRDPRRMIASLAYQIAEVLPQFRDALHKVREAEGRAADAYSLRQTARELADCLLFNPLHEIPAQPVDQFGRYVIIIDALDEAEHDAKSDLVDLVAFDFRNKLPPWVALLVTARPDVDIKRRLAPLRPTALDTEAYKKYCDLDVRRYLRSILADRFSDEDSLSRAIEKTAEKSGRLFLYMHYVRDMIVHGDDIDTLPVGLDNVYQKELESVLGPNGLGDEYSVTRRVVEAIIAAQVPVHVRDELPGLSGTPEDATVKLVSRLSRLLPVRDDRVHIFHKTFVDWLTRYKGAFDQSDFVVDRRAAHRRLASACGLLLMRLFSEEPGHFESDGHAVAALQHFVEARGCVVDDSQQSLAPFEYALRWSISHLVKAGGLEDVSLALLYSLRFLLKRAPQIDTLISDAAQLLPTTAFLHLALLLAQNNVRLHGTKWLAEELWQRLLSPAESREIIDLKRLALDAQSKARADLMFSARRAYFTAADSPVHCVLDGHSHEVKGVAGFVDAQAHTRVASCSDDNAVRIWDPIKGGEAVHVLHGHLRRVNSVTAFQDAEGYAWVASCSDDKTVRIWDPIKGGDSVRVLSGHTSSVLGVTAFESSKGIRWVASWSDDQTVRIWDPTKGGEVHMLGGHGGHSAKVNGVTTFVDTKHNTWVVSCSDDKTVRIWDAINGGEAVHVLKGHKRAVTGVAAFVDANGIRWVASCSRDTTIRIWDPTKGGKAVHVLRGHLRAVTGVTAFKDAKDNIWLASCSSDNTVRIWDLMKGGEEVHVLEGHTGWVNGLAIFVDAEDQMWVASCSEDTTVRIWDAIKGGKAVQVLDGHSNDVKSVTTFQDAVGHTWVASCSSDKTVRIWDPMKGGKASREIEGHSRKVIGVIPFVDAKDRPFVASCSWDNTVRIWDPINGGNSVRVFEGHISFCSGVTAFKDAKHHTWLASWSSDNAIHIWDPIKSVQPAYVLKGHSDSVSGVTAFADAEGHARMASCSHDKTVRIWDPFNGGEAVHVLQGHTLRVNGVKSFKDVKGYTWVASCSWDKTVRIWDPIEGGEAVNVLRGHSKKVNDVTAFVDVEGQVRLASCSDDATVRIWDPIRGGNVVRVLEGHSHDVFGVTSFKDNERRTWVASCSFDTTVLIWDPIKGGKAAQVLKGHASQVNGVESFVETKGVQTWLASWSDDLTVRIWDALKDCAAIFVIPLESPAVAVTTLSARASRGADRVCLIIGHEDGRVSCWDDTRQSDEHGLARLSIYVNARVHQARKSAPLKACISMCALVAVVLIMLKAAIDL